MTVLAYDYELIAPKVEQAFRDALGDNATIVTNPGYLGRIHAKVVSAKLDGKSEPEKQAYLWDILRVHLGDKAQAVSLVIGYGTDEL